MLDVRVSVAQKGDAHANTAVLTLFQQLVGEHHLERQVRVLPEELFTPGEDATVQVGDFIYTGIREDNARFVFEEYVMELVRA